MDTPIQDEFVSPNLGLDLVRITEAAALSAGRWMGLGKPTEADRAAGEAMGRAFTQLNVDGYVVIGEETKLDFHSPLDSGARVGTGRGPAMDVVADPIDGIGLLAMGHPDAIAVAGLARHGAMWHPYPAAYMEKLVVDRQVAEVLVPECLDAPVAWTLALIARAKGKQIRDLVVFILDRPRHQHLIAEIRAAGARVMARRQGDIAGALMAVTDTVNIDVMMGVGGVSEGVIAACAVKCLGGAMLGRLAPQSPAERQSLAHLAETGFNLKTIMTCDEMVTGCDVFFAATGITDGSLLAGVRYKGDLAETQSLIVRCKTGTRRIINAQHRLED